MSGAAKALSSVIQLLERFYESPSLAHTRALDLIDNELPELRAALAEAERQDMPAPYMRAASTLCHWCQGGPAGYVCPGCIDRRLPMPDAAPPAASSTESTTMPTTTLIDRPAYRIELGTERTRHGTVVKLITILPRDERREVQFILDDEALDRLFLGLAEAVFKRGQAHDLTLGDYIARKSEPGLALGTDENGCDRN